MPALLRKFWADQGGAFLNSAELVFLGSLLVIGIIPGIATLRDALVTEFSDMAAAVNPDPPQGEPVDEIDGSDGGQRITVASDIFGP